MWYLETDTVAFPVVKPLTSSVDEVETGLRRQKCAAFRSQLVDVARRGARNFKSIYNVAIPVVDTTGMTCQEMARAVKEWTECQAVRSAFRRLGRRERVGGRFAFKLLKKQFPSPCKCFPSQADAWRERQSKAVTAELPNGFLPFVVKEVKKMFPFGWDQGYVEAIGRYAPPTSACVGTSAKRGGSRAALSLDSYLAAVIGEDPADQFSLHYDNPLLYKEVATAGKVRPLTITPVHYNVLRPLHKIVFDRVARQRWSLIGPPSPSSFRKAGFKFSSPLLSGDYEGATDNLNLEVSRTILSTLLSTAYVVPEQVKERALASLSPIVKMREDAPIEEWVWVRRGTMMGSLLSFPLLCLYNRLATLWALGDVPMLVNGDDLAAETQDPEPWFSTLPLLGLKPERSKTGYSRSVVEINSTPFVVKGGRCSVAPVARTRVLAPRNETAVVGGQLMPFLHGFVGSMRRRAAAAFLSSKRGLVNKALSLGMSLADLGFSGLPTLKLLIDNKYLDLASTSAIGCPGLTPPPKSHHIFVQRGCADPVTSGASAAVYNMQHEDSKRFKRYDRMTRCGDLFGTVVKDYCESKEVINRWWDDVRAANKGIRPPTALTVQRSRLFYGGGVPLRTPPVSGRLHHGEPMSPRAFRRRLENRIVEQYRSVERLPQALAMRLPVVVRWGIEAD